MKLLLLKSNSNNPYYNLAVEELSFQKIKQDKDSILLYTWVNSPTVVIGRNQNPYIECNLEKMRQDGVFLARRKTGGGAVYHDLGNLNYTIIANEPYADKDKWNKIICKVLADKGIEAYLSGRNDLLVEDKKISGSAYLSDEHVHLQHGTMLVNVDKDSIKKYLTPQMSKLQKHGIQSVDQRICNLSEIDGSLSVKLIENYIRQAMVTAYSDFYKQDVITEKYIGITEIIRLSEEYRSDDFIIGHFSELDYSDDGL